MWPVLRAVGAGLLAVAWAIASYFNSASGQASGWGAALALAPLSLVVGLGLWRMRPRWLAAGLTLGLVGLLALLWPLLSQRIAVLYFLEHMGVYSLLAVFFARTLVGPGESLVTQMARRVHGGVLSENQQRYTRQVTLAWSVFFAGMVVVSVGLFLWAPLPAWSAFATLLGGPLIAVMFVGEVLVRRRVLPDEARASLKETVQAWRVQRSEDEQ
ncbi:hypothetical protein LPB072_08725 [Hydrogenophaga crassostreae]|nr:hypothetical protein LPB072_08725 [Hydrogenophaga crassostreae]